MIEIIPNWHPIFVHFTVTLLTISGVLQCVIWISKPDDDSPLWFARKWVNILGLLAVLLTVATGIHAYNTVHHDGVSHVAMLDHRSWAIATSIVFILGAIVSLIFPRKYIVISGVLIVISWGLVSATGFKGGELVYRYGLGVLSLPSVKPLYSEDAAHMEIETKEELVPTDPNDEEHHHDHSDHSH